MNCKDCFHYDMCYIRKTNIFADDENSSCSKFKDKSRIIELPCKVGDMVYTIDCCRCRNYENVELGRCHKRKVRNSPKEYGRKMFVQKRMKTIWDKESFVTKRVYAPEFAICYTIHKRPFKLEWIKKVGQTVFLSKEEAEERLEGLKDG